jgi:hypothetical protein
MTEYILFLIVGGSLVVISKCLFIYVDEFYELDFDIFVIDDK